MRERFTQLEPPAKTRFIPEPPMGARLENEVYHGEGLLAGQRRGPPGVSSSHTVKSEVYPGWPPQDTPLGPRVRNEVYGG